MSDVSNYISGRRLWARKRFNNVMINNVILGGKNTEICGRNYNYKRKCYNIKF